MRLLIVTLFVLLSQKVIAQENTLMDLEISSVKGFGGVVTKFSHLNDSDALLLGGRGGWIFNNSFVLGIGIYGLATNVPIDIIDTDPSIVGNDKMHFMYGGLEIEYIFNPENLIHYSVFTLIGLGAVSSHNNQNYANNFFDHSRMGNPFFVIEPAINVILNVTSFLNVAIGLSYRASTGAEYETINDKSLSQLNGNFTIKFKSSQ